MMSESYLSNKTNYQIILKKKTKICFNSRLENEIQQTLFTKKQFLKIQSYKFQQKNTMNLDEIRTPKHNSDLSSQSNPYYPKSQKFIKSQIVPIQNKSYGHGNKQYVPTASTLNSKEEDQINNSYIISLSQYQDRKSYDSTDTKQQGGQQLSRGSVDSQTQKSKRNLIYGNQSFKQSPQEMNQSSIQANNKIFQMVFLNKKKQYNDSISTTGSFSKVKLPKQVQEPVIKIQDFKLGCKLGSGKFGEVFIARHKRSGFLCAIKRINKLNIDKKLLIQLIREIKIQSFLSHPNIVKLYTFFCDQQYIYLVLELCYSGQLYDFLRKKRKLSQALTKNVVQQTLKALDYMHENQIIHRDLKPENIIFHNGMIKLCDFGWSISSKTMRETFCGTPLYVSPELLKRKNYNNKIDVWSVGILTYELLFGKVPFEITTEKDFIKIVEDEIKFSKATKISDTAKQFILICLKKDPRERYTVPELLQHPFITNQQPVSMADMY